MNVLILLRQMKKIKNTWSQFFLQAIKVQILTKYVKMKKIRKLF